tara:strand:+ start:74 stop:445 length:372 start_codon:yes stop_codon:yes gene_type:complete
MTFTSNTEQLKVIETDAYSRLFNTTLEDYESNMIDRFDGEIPSEEYLEECRYYEANTVIYTDYEALEAFDTEDMYELSQVIMKITNVVLENMESKPKEFNLGELYSIWKYFITQDVEWEIKSN